MSSSTLLLDSPAIDQGIVALSLDHAVTIRRTAGKSQHWLSVVAGQLRFLSWHAGGQGCQPPLGPAPEGSYVPHGGTSPRQERGVWRLP